MSDSSYCAAVLALMRLIDGLESGAHHCACGRYYKLGIANDLRHLLDVVRTEAMRRAKLEADEYVPDTARFALLEVDD